METNIKLKEIKINSSIKKYELKTTLLGYGNKGLPGKDGINGATFTPSVDNEGNCCIKLSAVINISIPIIEGFIYSAVRVFHII